MRGRNQRGGRTSTLGSHVIEPIKRRYDAGPTPSTGSPQLTHYPLGTYPSTVERVHFADGRQARTDLVRLHPTVDAYAVGLLSGSTRQPVTYHETAWNQAPTVQLWRQRREIQAVLGGSYPAVNLRVLSSRLRDAGYPLAGADLRDHEAIAATQAALWHLTAGIDLATRPTWQADSIRATGGIDDGAPLPSGRSSRGATSVNATNLPWHTTVSRGHPWHLEFSLPDRPQLGGYNLALAAPADTTTLRFHLERSLDGTTWSPVPTSDIPPLDTPHEPSRPPLPTRGGSIFGDPAGRDSADQLLTWHGASLGCGTTLATGSGQGYPWYRVVIETDAEHPIPVTIADLRVRVSGAGAYRNPERVVHLYRYLLDLARERPTRRLTLTRAQTAANTPTGSQHPPSQTRSATNGLVGPLRITGAAAGELLRVRAEGPETLVVDREGTRLPDVIDPSQEFFLLAPRRRTPLRLQVTCERVRHDAQLLHTGSWSPSQPGALPQPGPLVRARASTWTETATFVLDLPLRTASR